MPKFLIIIFFAFAIFLFSKKDKIAKPIPTTESEAIQVYQEALDAIKDGQYLIASEKFDQSESLLPQTSWAASQL